MKILCKIILFFEIEYHMVDDTLKININNNTRIEIVGVLYL
ncbi:hypothetical protein BD31_I1895 [Candidatus Nitrosopumilus salaria BD31]|uniref:Uncharacterized protein n=1 Tax=Candidatus Nitrosopumilus salarius BD31 TaxID=859350 RepID=I3D264_9ARCH|nr:hypothetical protein BD31_I1895 [Candidatus Nitrosopumilus salaria BD31]